MERFWRLWEFRQYLIMLNFSFSGLKLIKMLNKMFYKIIQPERWNFYVPHILFHDWKSLMTVDYIHVVLYVMFYSMLMYIIEPNKYSTCNNLGSIWCFLKSKIQMFLRNMRAHRWIWSCVRLCQKVWKQKETRMICL